MKVVIYARKDNYFIRACFKDCIDCVLNHCKEYQYSENQRLIKVVQLQVLALEI